MRKYQPEESHIRKVFQSMVELLFQDIPFSRKAEEAKERICDRLQGLWEKEEGEKSPLETVERILEKADQLEKVGALAGYSKEELAQLTAKEDLKDEKKLRKIFYEYKRYILSETFLIVCLAFLAAGCICNFSFPVLAVDLCLGTLFGGFLFFLEKKRKKYIEKSRIRNLQCDKEGEAYLQLLYDRYVKRETNMIFLCLALAANGIFSNVFSYLSFAYTFRDIFQQISSQLIVMGIFLFCVLKNIWMRRFLASYFSSRRRKELGEHRKKFVLFDVCYWSAVILVLLLLRNRVHSLFQIFLLSVLGNMVILILYNLTWRSRFVFENIRVNVRRCTAISLAAILVVSYGLMSRDVWLLQPYISAVSNIQKEPDTISYKEETGVYTITTEKEQFKILQLTDIHLGGSTISLAKDYKALEAVKKLLRATEPDLVIVTGDLVFPMGVMSFSLNNRAPIMQFASFMRNIGIPWAFTYGNHDTEEMSVITDAQFDDLMKALSYRSSKNLLYPYVQPDIYGRSNQLIEIRGEDGRLMQALFLLDSNDYIPGGDLNEYDYIHEDQVAWYEKQVRRLSEEEGYTIPSMLFFHIPLQEYKEAYELYEKGDPRVTYYYGEIGETMIDKICCSQYPSSLFDTAERLGSTKAMFCGHDHYNNLSVEYRGIRLTYGYSIDYLAMPGIEEDTKQRGATLITIDREGDFTIEPYRLMDLP